MHVHIKTTTNEYTAAAHSRTHKHYLTHIDLSLPGFSPIAPGPALPVVYILLCFAFVRTEQEEIKAVLSVFLQPTLLKRIAVEDEGEGA